MIKANNRLKEIGNEVHGDMVTAKRRAKSIAQNLPLVGGLFFTAATAASFGGRWGWALDLFSHFNWVYGWGLLGCAAVGLATRQRPRWVPLFFLVPAAVNAMLFAPFYTPQAAAVWPANQPPLRIASLNVYAENEDYAAVVAYIRQYQPDVIFFSEAEPPLMAYLATHMAQEYPYVYDESVRGTVGLAFISRIPFTDAQTIPYPSGRRRRLISITLAWQGQTVPIYAMHPYPPLGGRMATMRDSEISMVRDRVRDQTAPYILLGDFNATPWSYPMRQLTAATGLHYASVGFGLRPTWRGAGGLLSAPIDHILLTPAWQVLFYTTKGDIGSDHSPILVDVVLGDAP